jgi:hypothetical protein
MERLAGRLEQILMRRLIAVILVAASTFLLLSVLGHYRVIPESPIYFLIAVAAGLSVWLAGRSAKR